jgi:hypothetical protein
VGWSPTPLGDSLAGLVLLGLAVENNESKFSHCGPFFDHDRRCLWNTISADGTRFMPDGTPPYVPSAPSAPSALSSNPSTHAYEISISLDIASILFYQVMTLHALHAQIGRKDV